MEKIQWIQCSDKLPEREQYAGTSHEVMVWIEGFGWFGAALLYCDGKPHRWLVYPFTGDARTILSDSNNFITHWAEVDISPPMPNTG